MEREPSLHVALFPSRASHHDTIARYSALEGACDVIVAVAHEGSQEVASDSTSKAIAVTSRGDLVSSQNKNQQEDCVLLCVVWVHRNWALLSLTKLCRCLLCLTVCACLDVSPQHAHCSHRGLPHLQNVPTRNLWTLLGPSSGSSPPSFIRQPLAMPL